MKKQINLVLPRNIKSVLLTLSLLVSLFFSACKRDIINNPEQQVKINTSPLSSSSTSRLGLSYQEGDVVIGEQLKNPYTLQNMTTAYDSLIKKGVTSTYPVNIRETYYYIKFKPKTWDEYDDLKEDTTLELSDIPYDYEIIQNGNYYHDPLIPDSLPTYQYATVPAGFRFNDTIEHEILSPLYVPEVDQSLLGSNEGNELFVDHLLNEAYILTQNYEDTIDLNPTQRRPKYTPGGNIQIFDTRLNTNYGMEGIKVTARRWFIVYPAHADFSGNYRMNHQFRRPCNYSAWFEHKRFFVKKGGVHWINGPNQTGDWNHTISDGYDRFVGHIFRAGYRYHYKDIGGLQRPFRWLGRKTAYIAKDAEGTGSNPIFINNIRIWRFRDKATEYGSDDIFSTTSHETGHTSHAIRMNTVFQFWQVGRQLQESWAVCIEWYLTHLEYASRGIANYGEWNYVPATRPFFPNDQAYQYWNKADYSGWYTTMYIDIIDDHNEIGNTYLGWGLGVIDDRVSGYSLPFIESELLKHIYGLASLKEKLKENKPMGVTDEQIDLLIGFYY